MQRVSTEISSDYLRRRVVLLGDSGAGKTSMILNFVRGEFDSRQAPTIGAAFLNEKVEIGGRTISMDIWDTAGQERYHSLAPIYFRSAHGAIIVYDVANLASFEGAKKWVDKVRRQGPPNIVLALAGNKVDLADLGNRRVQFRTAEEYAHENDMIFFETSAKTGRQIQRVFRALAQKLPTVVEDGDADPASLPDFEDRPTDLDPVPRRKCCGGE